jgi:16S rRNA G966 N2-methylase RsmD
VDGDFGCVKFIKQVAAEYDFKLRQQSDVFKFLERNNASFDIIFADPPYALDQRLLKKIVLMVFEKRTQ